MCETAYRTHYACRIQSICVYFKTMQNRGCNVQQMITQSIYHNYREQLVTLFLSLSKVKTIANFAETFLHECTCIRIKIVSQ